MAAELRAPFQGVWNIIRFNWPFYAFSAIAILLLSLVVVNTVGWVWAIALAALIIALSTTLVSLVVSFYVYDLSGFYRLDWLDGISTAKGDTLLNINAGFDETSALLKDRFAGAELKVCDFYDPLKNTEASIKRARNTYPPFPGTQQISASAIPVADASVTNVFAIMSAHEIRRSDERDAFFSEVSRCLSPRGTAIVVEHLRDTANLFAYNIGAFHFHSRAAWLKNFEAAGLSVDREVKLTPFVSAFFLKKNGAAS